MTAAAPLAVRLENGVALPDAILDAARRAELAFADVSGFGMLEWVEIARGDGAVRLAGPFDLLDLKGRIRRAGGIDLADFVVTVSRHTDAGLEVLGGRLVRAAARFVELRVEPLAAAPAMEQSVAAQPAAIPAAAPPAPVPPAPRVEKPALGEKWAEALAESKRLERAGAAGARLWEDETAAVVPKRGDVVNHRQFGRCQVAKIDDDHIFLKKPDGRVVQLGLPILSFAVQGAEGEAIVFDVQVRR